MIRLGPSTILANDPMFGESSLVIEQPPRLELAGNENVCQ